MARIICVEDDELVGEIVCETLIAEGHAVGVVGDGETAIQVLDLRIPDLVILDAGLPGISGMDVLKRLRRNPALFRVPVLMLTGRRSAEDESIARHNGATEYLRKPFDRDELAFVVEEMLHAPKSRSTAMLY